MLEGIKVRLQLSILVGFDRTLPLLLGEMKGLVAAVALLSFSAYIAPSPIPIDDGTLLLDDDQISRRSDTPTLRENFYHVYDTASIDDEENEALKVAGRSLENTVDPSFVLSKLLYNMATLSSS